MNKPIDIVLIFLLFSLLLGCKHTKKQKQSDWNFDSIQFNKELYLIHTDDRFGEWGGNTYFVRVYRHNQTQKLTIDYKEYQGQMGPQEPPHPSSDPVLQRFSGQPIVKQSLNIQATEHELNLISAAVQELMTIKINNDEQMSMAGVMNRILFSDSTLIIEDYPSTNWEAFQKLKRVLTRI
ncbi:MAG: hypothetical protein P1U56_19025 [Saprospiraceae bacterium]|nr:hypothetical protein [Saprospiraceae bacterium]